MNAHGTRVDSLSAESTDHQLDNRSMSHLQTPGLWRLEALLQGLWEPDAVMQLQLQLQLKSSQLQQLQHLQVLLCQCCLSSASDMLCL